MTSKRLRMTIQGGITMPQEGKPAPAFELQDDQDRTVKLADFKGRAFVLYFFPRADTPG